MAYEIATPLTQLVLKRIEQERQFDLQGSDSTRARLQIVTGYNPRVFVADVEPSDLAGDVTVLDLTLGHYRGRRERQ